MMWPLDMLQPKSIKPETEMVQKLNQKQLAKLKAGPFPMKEHVPQLLAFYADETLLFFEDGKLPDHHKSHLELVHRVLSIDQQAMLLAAKLGDKVVLYQETLQNPLFPWLIGTFKKTGRYDLHETDIIPASRDSFYPKAVQTAKMSKLLMSTVGLHPAIDELLTPGVMDAVRHLSYKTTQAKMAGEFGIPMPRSFETIGSKLDSPEARKFQREIGPKIVAKFPGTGGALNVLISSSLQEISELAAKFPMGTPVLIQEYLDPRTYQEWTADFVIYPDRTDLDNVRVVLNADGEWLGNDIDPKYRLSESEKAELARCGDYLRSLGYVHKNGFVFGVDFFLRADRKLFVTEINPRWTGGYFYFSFLRKLHMEKNRVVAYFEAIAKEDVKAFQRFIEENLPLPEGNGGSFQVIPLGFDPMPSEAEQLWGIVVVGNFDDFARAAKHACPSSFGKAQKILATKTPEK